MNKSIDISPLIRLDRQKHIVFAYLACLRALPNSLWFASQYQYGNPNVFSDTIEVLHKSIFDSRAYSKAEYERQLKLVDEVAPGTNDFPNYDGTIAQDCGGVFYYSVQLLLDNDRDRPESLKEISTMLTDAVDAYVVVKNDLDYGDANFEVKIAADPVMIGEIKIQNGIIDFLKQRLTIDQDDLQTLITLQAPNVLDLRI